MDYFKHYSTASDSKLINHLFDEFGHTGYAYWFLLLELCAENWDGKSDPSFRFHTRIVRQKLRISLGKLEHFLGFCQGFNGVLFQINKSEIYLDIPKLAEVKTSRVVIKSNKKELTVYKDIDTELDIDKNASLSPVLEIVEPKKPSKKNLPKTQSQEIRNAVLFEAEAPSLEEEISVNQKAGNILTMFNMLTFSSLRPVPGNMKHINARLKEGYALEDFRSVIEFKYAQWVNNPQMSHCIRPQTFFSQNFDSYLQESRNALKQKTDPLDDFFAPYIKKMNEGA